MSERRHHNDSAERAFVGALLIGDHDTFDSAPIEPRDLFNLRYRVVYEAMRALRMADKPTNDIALLEVALNSSGALRAAGGLSGLTELLDVEPSPSSVVHYAEIIQRDALTRRLRASLSDLLRSTAEGEDLLAECMTAMTRVESGGKDRAVLFQAAVREVFEELGRPPEVGGLTTGYTDLDKHWRPRRGLMDIVAGRPSMGKSALARSIAVHVAEADGGVHYFSVEDVRQTLAMREVSDRSRVPLTAFTNPDYDWKRGEMHDVSLAVGRLMQMPKRMLVDDSGGLSAKEIGARVRKHRRRNETALVVVDYVQLLNDPSIKRGDKRVQVAVAGEDLATLARTEGVSVLLLSQLSRECEKRDNKRPLMSDLREAGELEQCANAVVMVYRDEEYNAETHEPGVTELIIRKNKNGRKGTVKLAWDAERATHRPLIRRAQ